MPTAPDSSASPSPTIAVIGAGFSGTLTAIHLARLSVQSGTAVRVLLFNRTPSFGPGLAYSTDSPVHYLNVPAGNMSAFDDDPGHFLKWAQIHQPVGESSTQAPIVSGSFVPRGVYGQYLRELLQTAQREHPGIIETLPVAVASLRTDAQSRVTITTADGRTFSANGAVLALGNALPPNPPHLDPALFRHPGYIASPWKNDAVRAILPDEPVFIVGTGLTMVDVVMQLHTQGHAGRIIALSRHGLLPRAHRSPSRAPAHREPPTDLKVAGKWNGDTRSLLRIIRQAVRDHAAKGAGGAGLGGDWRDVITSLRPITAHLWRSMPHGERERFLSRLRSFWEVVRHRAAPESAAVIADLIAARQLTVRAGRCTGFGPCASNPRLIDAAFRPRGSANVQTLRVARVINCMGPQTDIDRIDDPLVAQMRADGLIARDPFGTGIECADSGAVINARGVPAESIFLIGPSRKSQTWENTAVPELKKQAAQVASAVIGSFAAVRK